MVWLRLEDCFPENEKVQALSDAAFRAHIEALCFCARNLTDGRLTDRFVQSSAVNGCAEELLAAGLWEKSRDGVAIHDYLEYNPTRADVLAKRKAEADRKAEWRARKKSKGLRPVGTDAGTDAGTDGGSPAVSHALPDPTRPPPKGGKGRGASDGPSGGRLAPSPEAVTRWPHRPAIIRELKARGLTEAGIDAADHLATDQLRWALEQDGGTMTLGRLIRGELP